MSNIQEKYTAAMDLAEAAFIAKLKGDSERALQLTRQAFESEQAAAALIANQLDALTNTLIFASKCRNSCC